MRSALIILILVVCSAAAWDDNDFEVFDVVEEVNQNFYELMGVAQDASQQEVKSAFKKLTLKLHPDKNNAPDADVQFRNLVSVHNILKDPGKREKYNEVLKNGLPNWRSAVYYYRHVRKMGLLEVLIISFIIISFSQYAVGWAAYAEKRFTAEQILSSRGKKTKKSGFDTGLAEILDQLPKPSVKDTLPFQIPRFIWWMITAIPYAIIEFKRRLKEQKEEALRQKKREEEEEAREARSAARVEAARGEARAGVRRRRGFVPPERETDCLLDASDAPEQPLQLNTAPTAPLVSGGLWTDDDLAELVRLVKKYPGGTPDRWERIAETMFRSVTEVTHMAAKLKDNCYKVPGQETAEPPPPEPPKKVKTRKNEDTCASAANWSQSQQKALEVALAKFPKGGNVDRWEKIANTVQGKTKEECMQRCKYLSDLVKKQKQKEEEQREMENSVSETDKISNDEAS